MLRNSWQTYQTSSETSRYWKNSVVIMSGPMSVELQSVESASTTGKKPRRFSAGSGLGTSKVPPIQSSTAPASAPHLKERMSFRNPKVNQSVRWGGGKKMGTPF